MKKNSQIHLYLETEIVEQLKKLAEANNITFSEVCRRKLREIPQLNKIENLLLEIHKKLNSESIAPNTSFYSRQNLKIPKV